MKYEIEVKMKEWEQMLADELGAKVPSGPPLTVCVREPHIGWINRTVVIEHVVRNYAGEIVGVEVTLSSGLGARVYYDCWMIDLDLALYDEQPSLFHH